MSKCLKLNNFALIIIFILFSVYSSFNVKIDLSDLSDLSNIDKMVKEAMQKDREQQQEGINNISINSGVNISTNPFSALNRLTEKMLHDMDQEDEQDLTNIFSNKAIVLPKKKANSNSHSPHTKTTVKTTHKGNVHQEVTTTIGDGFQTIRVREVHVGGGQKNNQGIQGNQEVQGDLGVQGIPLPFDVFNLPLGVPTIIVGRPKNLKERNLHGEKAAPFQMFRRIDDIFDSFFENLLGDIIEEQHQANIEMEKSAQELERKLQNKMKKDHSNGKSIQDEDLDIIDEINNTNRDGHIKLTSVKDITNQNDNENEGEKKNQKITNQPAQISDTKIENKVEVEKNKQKVNSTPEEEHGLAIRYDTNSNKASQKESTDRVMTSKERKKQIKDEKKKAKFAKICKFVFYVIVLFTIYILMRRLLVLLGIIEDSKILEAGNTNTNTETVPLQTVEMKSTEKKD